MRIELEQIKEEPLEISEDIKAKTWEMDSFDIKFVGNIHLDCKFRRLGKEVFVECKVKLARDIICSRCLDNAHQECTQDFKRSYSLPKTSTYLDIDSDIREEILLNFPMKVLCSPDCKGICPGCGVNLNKEECRCKDNKRVC